MSSADAASGATRRQAYLITLAASLGWLFDSVVVNILTVALPQLEEAFALTSVQIGTITSLFLLGYGLGGMGGGTLADYVGRRMSLGISIVLYTVFSGLTAFAGSFGVLAGLRFLAGVGAGTELPVGTAYVAEVAPRHRRAFWIGAMNSVFSLGIIIAALVMSIFGNWRWAFASTFVMGALVLLVRAKADESPRFLQVKKDIAEGRLVRDKPTFADVFSRRYRARTIRIMLLWLGYWMFWWSWSIFVPKYLGTRFAVPRTEVLHVMMGYAVTSFFMQVFAGWFADKVGRRTAVTLLSALAIAAIWAWVYGPDGTPGVVLGGLAFAAALGPVGVLLVYTTEEFPTALRGTSQSMTIGFARLISVAAPTLGGYVAENFGMETEFRIVSLCLLISVVSILIGRETRGVDLVDHEEQSVADTVPAGVGEPGLVRT